MKWSINYIKELVGDFAYRCLTNDVFPQQSNKFKELWENSLNLTDFQEAVLKEEELRLAQATAIVLKSNYRLNDIFLHSFLGDNSFKTLSDCGGLKIGNDEFSFLVNNGVGDGETKVAILEEGNINRNAFDFITSVEGKFNIYSYDCGNEVICSLTGRYGVYSKNGIVIFEIWDEE